MGILSLTSLIGAPVIMVMLRMMVVFQKKLSNQLKDIGRISLAVLKILRKATANRMKGISNKKGQKTALEWIIETLLAFGLLAVVVTIVIPYLQGTDAGTKSYVSLTKEIQLASTGGDIELLSKTYHFKQGYALIGFTQDAQKVEFIQTGTDAFFERPSKCVKGKACLCLCRKGFKRDDLLAVSDQKLVCDEASMLCDSFGEINFNDNLQKEEFNAQLGVNDYKDYEFKGGFVIERKPGKTQVPGFSTSEVTVYLQRFKGELGLCFDNAEPCISEERKGELTSATT